MSNKTQGKLTFNVSKSDNKTGVHNIKSTFITQRDPIKKNIPVKKNILTTKRKRKSTETTNVKNQTITQFFTPSKCNSNTTTTTSLTTSNKTNNNNNNNNIETSSSSVSLQTLFSSKNTTHASLTDSNDNTDEENVICYIRNIHSVKEIWTSIVGEYGGESIRRVRPKTDGQGNMYDNEDKEILYLNEDEDNMIRPVRCKMSVQESLDFFKEITNEFLCI